MLRLLALGNHLQMLWQEGVSGVLLHALLVQSGALSPVDGVGVVHNDLVPVGDVHGPRRVSADVDFNHSVVVVQDVKVDVGEEVEPQQRLLPRLHELLSLPNEAPDGQIIIKHLCKQLALDDSPLCDLSKAKDR